MLIFWLIAISSFFAIFFVALNYFNAPKAVYNALVKVPVFMFLQVLSLFKARKANEISTATVHYNEGIVEELEQKKSSAK